MLMCSCWQCSFGYVVGTWHACQGDVWQVPNGITVSTTPCFLALGREAAPLDARTRIISRLPAVVTGHCSQHGSNRSNPCVDLRRAAIFGILQEAINSSGSHQAGQGPQLSAHDDSATPVDEVPEPASLSLTSDP